MAHEYLSTVPFDLPDLHLFHELAETGSFTRAARRTGLTQSSLTRRIQNMEERLGTRLFERTTRVVALTEAGRFMRQQSARLIGDVSELMRRLREEYAEGRREIAVGVSRSICLAHLPGLFSANRRLQPDVLIRVTHKDSSDILDSLDQRKLDFGVLCPPKKLPPSVATTHRFEDAFVIIASSIVEVPNLQPRSTSYRRWLAQQRWLTLDSRTQTSCQLNSWLETEGLLAAPAMELDSFDVIIHLVALGMGVALVPQRGLAAFPRRHSIRRLTWKNRFTRELVVLSRKDRQPPEHLARFVENILF